MKNYPQSLGWKKTLGATLWLLSGMTQAEMVQLTAEFSPSVANPVYEFVNTTPQAGLCVLYPAKCPPGSFSIQTGITVSDRIYGNDTSPVSQQNYQALDAEFKDVEMVHSGTGERAMVRFRLNVLTQRIHHIWQDISEPNAYPRPIGGCTGYSGMGHDGNTRWAWEYPNTTGIRQCHVTTLPTTNLLVDVSEISIGYLMETPDPLKMASGIWTGSIIYTVGSGQQIDFGEGHYSGNQLEFQITAEVKHIFEIRQLPGTERVILAPKDGWAQWLNSQSVPPKLMRDMPFIMTSSGPFSVALECEHVVADNCALMNTDNGQTVPFNILLTMPGIIDLFDRQPANRHRVRYIVGPQSHFESKGFDSTYINSRSTIHFEVDKPQLEEMLKQPGSTWQGTATLIFDAKV